MRIFLILAALFSTAVCHADLHVSKAELDLVYDAFIQLGTVSDLEELLDGDHPDELTSNWLGIDEGQFLLKLAAGCNIALILSLFESLDTKIQRNATPTIERYRPERIF